MSVIDPVEIFVCIGFFEKANAVPSMVSDTDAGDRDFTWLLFIETG